MLKTTRKEEGKQTEPSKTLVHIIRNRLCLKTARLLIRRNSPVKDRSGEFISRHTQRGWF